MKKVLLYLDFGASGFLEYNSLDNFKDSADLFLADNPNLTGDEYRYDQFNWDNVESDVWNKCKILSQIGINLNFAPVVDVASSDSYIYNRTLKQRGMRTSFYAKAVIEATKALEGKGLTAHSVSYTLKHFPGYGNSVDTHGSFSMDSRELSEFESSDLLPFIQGIQSGAECIMVSHNVIECMESDTENMYPASISKDVHNYLRNKLGYTNIIITDALNMGAIYTTYTSREAIIRAVNAGNDMICISLNGSKTDSVANSDGEYETLNYENLINYVKTAVENYDNPNVPDDEKISEYTINLAVRRIIAWKMYKGLL